MIQFCLYPYEGLEDRDFLKCYPELFWEVEVLTTRSAFTRRARKAANERKYQARRINAVVMPQHTIVTPKRGQRQFKPYVSPRLGIVLFFTGRLKTEILVHESVHLALSTLRHTRQTVKFGKMNDDREETLAYVAGNIGRLLAVAFYEHKVWK